MEFFHGDGRSVYRGIFRFSGPTARRGSYTCGFGGGAIPVGG
jgi:hypothetical protein